LARNWAWSVVDESLVLSSAVVSVLLLIPRLGPANYGAWAALFALVGPFAALAHIGIRLTILEGIVRDRQSVSAVARSCITLALLLSGLMAPIVTIAGLLWIETLSFGVLALFVASELVANALINSLVSIVQGAYSYAKAIQLKLAVGSARIMVLLLLVALQSVSIENLIFANAAMLFLATPLVYLAASSMGLGPILPGRIQPGHFGTTVTYGLGIGSSIVQNDGDKVVLNAYGHQADSGLYAAGYRLAYLAMMPLQAFLSSSHFDVLEAARTSSNQLRKAAVFAGITLAYAIPAVGGLVLFAPMVPLILGSEFKESSVIMQLVAPIAVIRYLGGFACNGLLGLNRNVLRMWLLVGGAAFSLVLYIVLIPAYSWRGALVGSLAGDTVLAAGCWIGLYWSQKRAEFHPPGAASQEE
jgi:O-antigen/teichoic acid export membrane protein